MTLDVQSAGFAFGAHAVLSDVSIRDVARGTVTAVIGPNAAGKSTLFRGIAGVLRMSGTVHLDGRRLDTASRREQAQHICYLPQHPFSAAILTAFEAVLLARKQRDSWRVTSEDRRVVADTMALLGIGALAERYVDELSGGQQQLVSVAQALVRQPSVLLMDEPTSALDLRHQLEVLALLRHVAEDRDVVVMMAVHDLNLAARFADRLVMLSEGRIIADGDPATVLTRDRLGAVYGVEARVEAGADRIQVVTPLHSLRATGWRRSAEA